MLLVAGSFAITMITVMVIATREGENTGFEFLYLIPILLSLLFGMITIDNLNKGAKTTWVGVCDMLFCAVVGGVLYLVWDPYKRNEPKRVAVAAPAVPDAGDRILKLKQLKDAGAITEEDFEKKKNELLERM